MQIPLRPIAPEENTEWKYKYTVGLRAETTASVTPATVDPYARKFVPPPSRRVDDVETGELPPAVKRRKKANAAPVPAEEDSDE